MNFVKPDLVDAAGSVAFCKAVRGLPTGTFGSFRDLVVGNFGSVRGLPVGNFGNEYDIANETYELNLEEKTREPIHHTQNVVILGVDGDI